MYTDACFLLAFWDLPLTGEFVDRWLPAEDTDDDHSDSEPCIVVCSSTRPVTGCDGTGPRWGYGNPCMTSD
eukprot:XP_001707510.1 Hypothetical protein GL50803_5131 [Giardia lamblia ATCC 50803]